jgi:hypothetical protein
MKTWQDILTYEALDLLGPQPELKDDPAELLVEVSVAGLTLGDTDLQLCGRALLTLVRYHASLV